ncbi:MAG: ATP-binding protein [Pseudomonadota bacterium]
MSEWTEREQRLRQLVGRERNARKQMQQALEERNEMIRVLRSKMQSKAKQDRLVAERTEELLAARDEAISASVAKSNFVATMSHEIRTPINGIIGVLDLLSDCEIDAEGRKLMSTAQSSAELLCRLVNDILDFSKIEAGKLQIEVVAFDLRELVVEVARGFEVAGLSKSVSLQVDIANDVDRWVSGDPTRLRQVLTNLVGNAVKFTEEGTVDITVRRAAPYSAGTNVLFEVNDSGIGIAPGDQEHLFEPFTQADGSITRKFGGSGLGLVICRRLIELMGGAVALESALGLGTKVSFEIKFAPGDMNEATYARLPMGDLRMLMIEADADAVELVEVLCKRFGMRLRHVPNAAEGLGAFHEAAQFGQPFSAVLFDPSLIGDDVGAFATRLDALMPAISVPMVCLGEVPISEGSRDDLVSVPRPLERRSLYKALLEALGPDESTLEPKKTVEEAPASTPITCGKLLVVEDNANNQRVISAMLKKLELAFEIANNGEEAVQMVAESQYDLVLMDMQMPVMNGLDATRAIRDGDEAWRKALPIVALTANAMPEDRQACLDAGMNDYLTKPVRRKSLRMILEKWLDGDPQEQTNKMRVISPEMRARI